MIGRENRDSQEIAERIQKDDVLASQFFCPNRLVDLKRAGAEEEILKSFPEVVKAKTHLALLWGNPRFL
jgi:hypothetical protein